MRKLKMICMISNYNQIIHFLGISLIKYNDNDKQECNNIMISFNNKSITISSDINCDDVTYEQGMTMQ